ncbi:DUF924 domain-containing protein [Piscinibacter aquaticus]|uniref:DUF924 domain-containing protein n=1 Tax=Piscinibacter aquaticus TaxID=392597 RepID=A0A5C6U074_9BURK|nr:DUF924 domain-containing protein [Piscinibacter aquaticus]
MEPRARAVLDFWFGSEPAARPEWFRKDPAFDDAIRDRFAVVIEATLAGERFGPAPAERLAAIVVLDQFTRNVFRDTPRAFAGDAAALALANQLCERGDDLALPLWQRAFAYLPFEHAEDLTLQDRAVAAFEALAAEHPDAASMLDYAHRHREVIRRFGRFPHRNEALGRRSTADELAFLGQPGSRF